MTEHTRANLLLFLAVLVAGSVIWAVGLFAFADSLPDRVEDPATRTDAIVVLTGGSGRLEAGLDLLAGGMAGALFVSGVYQGMDVRNLLRAFERSPGQWQARVEIGNAVNTVGNAAETAKWMRERGFTSLRLVTGAYHMPRSLLEFRNAMPGLAIVPHPVFPSHVKQERWWAWPGTAGLIAGEFNKFLLAWLHHAIKTALAGKTDP